MGCKIYLPLIREDLAKEKEGEEGRGQRGERKEENKQQWEGRPETTTSATGLAGGKCATVARAGG